MQHAACGSKHENVVFEEPLDGFRKICGETLFVFIKKNHKPLFLSTCGLVFIIPLMLGCFLPVLCIRGVGLALDRRFGKANMAKEASISKPEINTKPAN